MRGAGALRRGRSGGTLAAALALSACVTAAPPPAPNPALVATSPRPQVAPAALPRSAESERMVAYYARLQATLLEQGLMRGDGGGPDAPFTDSQLARDFVRIALFDEYTGSGEDLRALPVLTSLHRWDRPIAMSVQFGPTIPLPQRDRDRASVAAFAARLSRLTGVPIRQTDVDPNYFVLFLNEDERRHSEPLLRQLVPGIDAGSIRTFETLPRDQLCVVITFTDGRSAGYATAVAIIRGEHPDLMRLSCIHEELAQGMGLANDSPQARPSIFNDDEEFGLLTRHDELLLKMLYDPRLHTGMTAAEAAPIARRIVRELMAGAS